MGKKMQGILEVVISLVVILLVFPILTGAVHSTQTTSVSETHAGVVTTAGTSGSLTLTTSAWQARAASVSVSGGVGDTPTVASVSANGLTVVVSGLATSATRALTAVYQVDALSDYTGMSTFISLIPFLVLIGAVGALVFGLFNTIKG